MDRGTAARYGIVIAVAALCSALLFFNLFAGSSAIRYHPHTDSTPVANETHQPEWLIATITASSSVQRRMIIRHSWQKLFANPSRFTTRFVINRAVDPIWQSVIDEEIATYGDIIQMNHLEENHHIATTIKSIELYKHLMKNTSIGIPSRNWKWISKVDDDSYVDANAFYRDFLEPNWEADRTIIARPLPQKGYICPGGQFYTTSVDLIQRLVELQKDNPLTNSPDDCMIGELLYRANETWTTIELPNTVAFDYEATNLEDKLRAYAAEDADLTGWRHAVGIGSINPHHMRDDETYVKVAACFDENGVKIDRVKSWELTPSELKGLGQSMDERTPRDT